MSFNPKEIKLKEDGNSFLTLFAHIDNFKNDAEKIVNRELPDWLDGQFMYSQCFNPEDDLVNLYNPDLLADTVQRILEQYKFAGYKLEIPGASDEEIQVVRDAIEQQMRWSGLVQGVREDPRGALSQILLGNSIIWVGTTTEEKVNEARPIKMQFARLSKSYFSSNAINMRTASGDNDVSICMLVFEFPEDEIKDLFPGLEFKPGRMPFINDDDQLQQEELADEDEEGMTEVAYFYDINLGIKAVLVGQEADIPDDQLWGIEKKGKYPHILDSQNVVPVAVLKMFRVLGRFHGKGLYHKFGKIARNSSRRRSSAHRYMDRNIDPDRFIIMNSEDFSEFQMKVDEAQLARQTGLEPYVQIDPSQGVPQTVDNRTQPLTGEFERAEIDNLNLIKQGGVSIQDIDRPASETATATAAEEVAKTRLAALMARNNATEQVFIRKMIVEAIKLIPKNNETPVSTNVRIKFTDTVGIEKEAPVDTITYGQISNFLNGRDANGIKIKGKKPPKVYIEEDISQFESIGLELALLDASFSLSQGTPAGSKIQQKMLGLLGQETLQQDLTPQNVQETPQQQLSPESITGQGLPL